MDPLILYSRKGCCLCEGLEERLREILPPDHLQVVDVDGDPVLQARYDLSVPVLARAGSVGQSGKDLRISPLPPVPPRLRGQGLQVWLQRHAC